MRSFKKYVKHERIGVWDVFTDLSFRPVRAQWPSADTLPFLWRMLNDISHIPGCPRQLAAFILVQLLLSLLPAAQLACAARFLKVVHTAVDSRSVDQELLLTAVLGAFSCSMASHLLQALQRRITTPLKVMLKTHYSVHIFQAMARLDVPTFDDPAVQRQLQQSLSDDPSGAAFSAIFSPVSIASTVLQIFSQLSILTSVLKDQPDGPLLSTLCALGAFAKSYSNGLESGLRGVWLATTKDQDFVKSQGLKLTIQDARHRKEIVASAIAPFLFSQFRQSISRIRGSTGDFYEALANSYNEKMPWGYVFSEAFRFLPEVVFVLRAIHQPSAIPVSLTSLHLVQSTTDSFSGNLFTLVHETGDISKRLNSIKQLYQIINIPNRVRVYSVDDSEDEINEDTRGIPFPENDKTLASGISIEFSNVSFKYPGTDFYALRNISFKIERGQLCVIVGNNGSGKSTILKLITRLYDPTEGTILIDGLDIKTLRLADLRRATSVLFQDYTYFPLSVRDNIGIGNPEHAHNFSMIERAAKLGGADGFISRLPQKYDTFLDPPVRDHFSGIPEGTEGANGVRVDFTRVREAAGIPVAEGGGGVGNRGISGGQMQRIALSRMFMRSVVSDERVGLLLFDEPSASLDPTAEHDLFDRLRTLRGNKTMMFSSHRFGNLTRYADLILYMDDSLVVEEGTHEDLIKQNGEYARIWKLQAQAFL